MRDASDEPPVAVAPGREAAGPIADSAVAERRCILSGAKSGSGANGVDLLRLVADADGRIWPDFAGRLPGRGAWIVPDRALLEQAIRKGKLAGALARSLHRAVSLPEDLPAQIASGLEQRALQRLGLEHRAGHLIFGSDKIGEWIAGGRVSLLLHAADAAADGTARLDQLWRVNGGQPDNRFSLPAARDSLSRALGRENVVHSGVRNGKAAARIARELRRWVAFSSGTMNPTDDGQSISGRRNDEGRE